MSAKSENASAICYTFSWWQAPTRYCDNGRIEIDNNGAERAFLRASNRKKSVSKGSDRLAIAVSSTSGRATT